MRTVQAGAEFAQWLGETHPEVYEVLFAHAIARGAGSRRLSGLGDVTDDFGASITDFTPTLQDIPVDTGNIDYLEGSAIGNATDALPFSIDMGSTASSPVSSTAGVPGQTTSVGNWLTSPQGLTAIAGVGTAVLGTLATANVAKAQMAVIQAQAQRAQAGLSPAPISYVTGANGQPIPVYAGGGGQTMPSQLVHAINSGISQPIGLPNGQTGYTLNSSTLSSVLGGNSLWILLAAGALLLALAMGQS